MDRFEHSVEVNVPVAVCYQKWHRFEDFPKFMANVEEVSRVDNDVWHWVVSGPLGRKVEWDAAIDVDEPNRVIRWHSIAEEPDMSLQGEVRFETLAPDRCRLTNILQYEAPLGSLGDTVTGLVSNPQQMVIEDLENFKRLAEEGVAGYNGPYGIERALPDDVESMAAFESAEPLDDVGTPYLGSDGALGIQDPLEMRQDKVAVVEEEDVYGQDFVETDIFTSSMDVYSEDLESFVEDLDEDIDSSYVLTEDIEAFLEEGRVESENLAVPLSEGRSTEDAAKHPGGTDSPGTGEELQR